MPTFTFSTPDSYAEADPLVLNPPMVTDDGHDPKLAHGHRNIPVVGGMRLPYLDVSFAAFNEDPSTVPVRTPAEGVRVYADDYDDAFAAFAGQDCQHAAAVLRALEKGEDISNADAADADLVLQDARCRFSIPAATIAQRHINARAQQPEGDGDYDPLAGLWDTLTTEEQDILTANAHSPYDEQGRLVAPIQQGIVIDWDLATNTPDVPPAVVKRGSWSARVPLVVCEQNYWPDGGAIPLLETITLEFNGRKISTETNGEVIKTIHVTDSQTFIEDLAALDVITLDVRPPTPFDEPMRDIAHEFFGNDAAHHSLSQESE